MKSKLFVLVGTDIFKVQPDACPFYSELEPNHVLFASDAGILVSEKGNMLGIGDSGASGVETRLDAITEVRLRRLAIDGRWTFVVRPEPVIAESGSEANSLYA